jgi:hypothetical protein
MTLAGHRAVLGAAAATTKPPRPTKPTSLSQDADEPVGVRGVQVLERGAKARRNYAATSPITRASGKKKIVAARFVHLGHGLSAAAAEADVC